MDLVRPFVSWRSNKRIEQVDHFKNAPFEMQEKTLLQLLKKSENTEFGSKYSFQDITNIDAFQNRVPLHQYEDIKSYIDRVREGEKDVIWPGEIKWFAKSSGTTSDKSKFIPVSRESLENCHFRGMRDIVLIYCYHYPNTRIFPGKSLTLGGSTQINSEYNDSYVGDLSAILMQNSPFLIHLFRAPRKDIALMEEWEEKLARIAQTTVNQNVTSIAGVPSWNLVLLKYILQYTGKKNILEVWPNLELFMHGGVSFSPYKEQFYNIIPSSNMHYMEAYNASEGFFAIQDDPTKDDMLLMLDYGIFYEFIPFEDIDSENPTVLALQDVEAGKNYALVITTNAGLWRYVIGDLVQFTSTNPYRIKISGRTKHFINAFGEEVIIDNAEKALDEACKKTGASIKEYTAGPVYFSDEANGTHEWLIEFEQPPADMSQFTDILDKTLQSVNSDYEAKRYKDITLRRPEVRQMKQGTFYQWMKERGKLGGQNKVPRMANHRRYLEDILQINEKI